MRTIRQTYRQRVAVGFLALLFSAAFLLHEWHTIHFHNAVKISDCCEKSGTDKNKTHWHDENTHHHCDWLCGALPSNFESQTTFVLNTHEKLIAEKPAFAFVFGFVSSPFSFSQGRAPPVLFSI